MNTTITLYRTWHFKPIYFPFHNLGHPYLSPTPKAEEIVIAVLTVYETLSLLSLLCLFLDYFLYLIIIISLICWGSLCKQSLQSIINSYEHTHNRFFESNILRVTMTDSQTQMPDCYWIMSWFIWPNRCLDWVDVTCAICELQIVSSRIFWLTHHAGLYLSHQPLLMCVWKKEAVFRTWSGRINQCSRNKNSLTQLFACLIIIV